MLSNEQKKAIIQTAFIKLKGYELLEDLTEDKKEYIFEDISETFNGKQSSTSSAEG
jgi:hypothetical protein